MYKKIVSILLILIMIQVLSFAEEETISDEIIFLVGSNKAYVNNEVTQIDTENLEIVPEIISSRTYLPIRFVAESLGAEVGWDEASQFITIKHNTDILKLQINQKEAIINDQKIIFEEAPYIKNNRSYVQLSVVLEAFNKQVYYKDGIIIISSNEMSPTTNYIELLKDKLTSKSLFYNDYSKSIVKIKTASGKEATGFFVSEFLVLTNYHVISENNGLEISSIDGQVYPVNKIYWYDYSHDLALIQTSVGSESVLNIAKENLYEVGDSVRVIGHPLGLDWSMSEGVISAKRYDNFLNQHFIQTDVSVTFGSSGSPLIKDNGEVIGIITRGIEGSDINFASELHQIHDVLNNGSNLKESFEDSEDMTYNEMNAISNVIFETLLGMAKNDRTRYTDAFSSESKFYDSEDDIYDEVSKMINTAWFGEKNYLFNIKNHEVFCYFTFKPGNRYNQTYGFTYYMLLNPETELYEVMSMQWYKKPISSSEQTNETDDPISKVETIEETVVQPSFDFNLEFVPFDIIFHDATDSYYLTNRIDQKIVKFNVNTKKITEITVDYLPERMVIENDKLYVTLPTSKHVYNRSIDDMYGYLGIYDLNNLNELKLIKVAVDPYDVAVAGDTIYVTCGSDQFTEMISISESTEQEISRGRIRQASEITIRPNTNEVYTITSDTSPRDFHVFNTNNSILERSYDSKYHGEYRFEVGFKMSPDGKYVINYSGDILTLSANRDDDLIHYKALNQKFNDVIFDGDYMIAASKENNLVYIYDHQTFELIREIETQNIVKALFYNGSTLITIEESEGYYGMMTYENN